jgi:hypothetical protein
MKGTWWAKKNGENERDLTILEFWKPRK